MDPLPGVHDDADANGGLGIRRRPHKEPQEGGQGGGMEHEEGAAPFQGGLVRYPPPRSGRASAQGSGRRRGPGRRAVLPAAWAEKLYLRDFLAPQVWRAAAIEGVGTGALVFASLAATLACIEGGFLPVSKAVGLVHVAILSLFILATAPSSGGHLNPSITMATVLTGLTSLPRGILYILAQSAGSIVGSAVVKGVLSHEKAEMYQLGGCLLHQTLPGGAGGPAATTGLYAGRGLLSEFGFTFVLLYVSFGIALDPKQGAVFGPALAPFLIGTTLGLLIFVSGSLMAPGYVGAGMNPARCFGPAVVMGGQLWKDNWVFWVGPMLACLAIAFLYNLIPPYHDEIYASGRDVFRIFRTKDSPRAPPPDGEHNGLPETHDGAGGI